MTARKSWLTLASLSAALLASCTPPAFTYVESRMPAPQARADERSPPPAAPQPIGDTVIRASGAIVPEPPANTGPIVRQDGIAQPRGVRGATASGPAGDISLNYVDADVREVVRLILGNILKVNYSIDPGLQGSVTIQTARPLRRDELLPTLQSVLEQAGGTMTFRNGFFPSAMHPTKASFRRSWAMPLSGPVQKS